MKLTTTRLIYKTPELDSSELLPEGVLASSDATTFDSTDMTEVIGIEDELII